MKKLTFILLLLNSVYVTYAQTTYYWVGGTNNTWLTPANWNTKLDATGAARNSTTTSDILIIDGSNVGGASPTTGPVTINVPASNNNIGQIKLTNNADVSVYSTNTASPFYRSLTATSLLEIDASSSLTLKDNPDPAITSFVLLSLGTAATASIKGKLVTTGKYANRVLTQNSSILPSVVFHSGSSLHTGSGSHPFAGSPDLSVMLSANSTITYNGGSNPFSGNTINFSPETNYVFNTAITAPFHLTSSSSIGDLTINAPVTTNRSVSVTGVLSLNSKLTIRTGDVVTLTNTGTFGGVWGASSYIVTNSNSTNGLKGVLEVSQLNAAKLIPVGSASNYLPIVINPQNTSDFAITVFEGITNTATPNGPAFTSEQKKRVLDVVWDVSRSSGTGTADITFAWPDAVEGSDFSAYHSSGVGISIFDGTSWGAYVGSGDHINNSATATFGTFAQFSVGNASTTLPVTLIDFAGKVDKRGVEISWKASELNLAHYNLQRSSNGKLFNTIATITPNTVSSYIYRDLVPESGINYYRLISVDKDGTQSTSDPISVNFFANSTLSFYPNPIRDNVLNINGLAAGDVIRIINLSGSLLLHYKTNGSGVESINVHDLASGTYILIVENAGRLKTSDRIIKI
ncbi:T9SS type A sorting domain-containing protein [Desertivirga xinjiangensis]|uniref:T9SS type A sorting domain-containing protein n=1 Tax=Desertivirga xinjiangensis TaxID=539206 RepID=UPI00210E89DA|nr:T9SS type A sorting domain-containing protein [Pedobacter xinjiangensis]